jgi:CheY-like chemotaxis protein
VTWGSRWPHIAEVLVVDDEEAVRRLLELLLRRTGFTVRSAASGQEAVNRFREYHESIAVVLLDVQMPGMDGPATLAALHEIDPNIECCFMSGGTGKYAPEELLGLGAAHLFRKPLTDWSFMEQTLLEMAHGELCHSS